MTCYYTECLKTKGHIMLYIDTEIVDINMIKYTVSIQYVNLNTDTIGQHII